MVQSFSNMRDSQLRKISVVKNFSDLSSGITPVYAAPHRAGPKVHKLQRVKIASMREQEVTKPARPEWVAQNVRAT